MGEKKISVSACIIAYNHEEFIVDCLEGAISQQLNCDYKIIIGEDCSSDNTLEICEQYQRKYPDLIKIIRRPKNLGLYKNWFSTLSQCEGGYIAICEGDDYWTDPYKLQKQVDFLEENEDYVISFHDVTVLNDKGEVIKEGRIKNQKSERSQEELICGAHLPTPTVLFRNVISNYPEEFFYVKNADTFLFSLLGHFGKGFRHFDIKNSVYRKHSGGAWSGESVLKKFISKQTTFEAVRKVSDEHYHKKIIKKLLSINYHLIRLSSGIKKIKYGGKFIYYAGLYLIKLK